MKNYLWLVIITFMVLGFIYYSQNVNKNDYVDNKFKVGQVWKYHNRPTEPNSKLIILKTEKDKKLGVIIHISIENILFKNPKGKDITCISHVPISKSILEKSITILVKEKTKIPDMEGYRIWKESFDSGKAGIFTISVSDIVKYLEEAMNK